MKKWKYLIIGLVILAVIGGIAYFKKSDDKTIGETFEVKKGEVISYIEEKGTVKSHNQGVVSSKSNGEVMSFNVEVGDKIKKEDIVAVINTDETDTQIKILQTKLESVKASYKEATKQPDKEIIGKAEANLRTADIMAEKAKGDAEKAEKLYEEGAISSDNYQNALTNLKLKEEALQIAKDDLESIKKGPSENIKKQFEAQISELEYQLDILNKNKGNLFIKSNLEGTVLETFIKEGSFIQIGAPVVEIGDEEKLYIEADILASEIKDVQEGAEVIIYSDDLGLKEIKGKVTKVYPKAFSKISDLGIEQKRVKVDIEILDKVDILKIGYELNIRVITSKITETLFIPDTAIFDYEDGTYVYIIKDGKPVLRKVEVGLEGKDNVEIISGLNEGEKVLINPSEVDS